MGFQVGVSFSFKYTKLTFIIPCINILTCLTKHVQLRDVADDASVKNASGSVHVDMTNPPSDSTSGMTVKLNSNVHVAVT